MTPQQAAEAKYPYVKGRGIDNELLNRAIDLKRQGYNDCLTDQPQLSRSVLEEVREIFISIVETNKFPDEMIKSMPMVNLDDLLPVGDGWIDVKDRLPMDRSWVLVYRFGIPQVGYYFRSEENDYWVADSGDMVDG